MRGGGFTVCRVEGEVCEEECLRRVGESESERVNSQVCTTRDNPTYKFMCSTCACSQLVCICMYVCVHTVRSQ